MTFPRTEGQIPVYYNYFNTGRPARNENDLNYVSAYIDLPNSPKFPFGYGLSYTKFSYSDVRLSQPTMNATQKIIATVTVTNSGNYDGEEVVQLYIRDLVGSMVRPVKELKGFRKIFLKKGESKQVSFTITADELKFYNADLKQITEQGEFKLYIGTSSHDVKEASFQLIKSSGK